MASPPTIDGPTDSVPKRKGSPCQQDDDSQDDKRIRSGVDLPEDIFWYIHALMPLRDAARAACVSRSFLQSWRCYPYLSFSKETIRLDNHEFTVDETTRDLISKTSHILHNHSGIGVKKLELVFFGCTNVDFSYFDSWLNKVVKPGIEKLTLILPRNSNAEYSFPCSLLSDGNENSIRYLNLSCCSIRPTVDIGCLRTLTTVHLSSMRITGFELECLLSNSLALESLTVIDCKEIVQLKIPCLLKRLHNLVVDQCEMLKVVENYAPNVTIFDFSGHPVPMLGFLQVKHLEISCLHQSSILCYALANLLSVAPNVESLGIYSHTEIVGTQTVSGKYLRLKYLQIVSLNRSPDFDYLSLVSFLDVCPSLQTFILHISDMRIPQGHMGHAWTVEDSAELRQMPGHRHDNLKKFEVAGFCYSKSLFELTWHILETTSSLNRVKLDTACNFPRCSSGRCISYYTEQIMEALNVFSAIKTYMMEKVPPTVKFNLVPPCTRCLARSPLGLGGIVDRGDLAPVMRFMSAKRQRHLQRCRRQIRRRELISSVAKTNRWPCQQNGSSQDDKGIRSGHDLEEEIIRHIHSLIPLRDAARVACVSHAFLRSWRCYPYLIFSKERLRLDKSAYSDDEITRNLISKVNRILQNHSGIGVKKLELIFLGCTSVDFSYFDNWLHKAVTPVIEELTLIPPENRNAIYRFPCSLLSDVNVNSIRYLHLSRCAIRSTIDLVTELECLLSNSPALECLRLLDCKEIVLFKIPCLLKRLHSLRVNSCEMLTVVESYAPNIATFDLSGHAVEVLGLDQVKNLEMTWYSSSILYYALTNLVSVAPNVEKLGITSRTEVINAQTVLGKFLHLKHLKIFSIEWSPNFDYLSLVSFLDASPLLETFKLHVGMGMQDSHMGHAWTVGDSAPLRQMPDHHHNSLKKFKVSNFCYWKSLVELTCHILETTSSLNHVKLDTACGYHRCSSVRCDPNRTEQQKQIMEAHNAFLTVKTYILGKVPSTVKFNLVQRCSRCRALIQ
uniref:At1g61320/AtMIF1 LRR domain-containing protein n=1 Tax=Leersia perrieri TaxID=77586 RepID=A0A0D9XFC6_9ORYZ